MSKLEQKLIDGCSLGFYSAYEAELLVTFFNAAGWRL
jgi:hypothetical protein